MLYQNRRTASLIGCLGQARFPSFFWAIVTHPGHASLRSLVDAVLAPLHACVGLAVENLASRRASIGAAVIFGFFYYQAGHVYMPERARTSSGEGRPRQLSCQACLIIQRPPAFPDGTLCHLSTCGAAERPVCGRRQPLHDDDLLCA